jgi:hypothetical protein
MMPALRRLAQDVAFLGELLVVLADGLQLGLQRGDALAQLVGAVLAGRGGAGHVLPGGAGVLGSGAVGADPVAQRLPGDAEVGADLGVGVTRVREVQRDGVGLELGRVDPHHHK